MTEKDLQAFIETYIDQKMAYFGDLIKHASYEQNLAAVVGYSDMAQSENANEAQTGALAALGLAVCIREWINSGMEVIA